MLKPIKQENNRLVVHIHNNSFKNVSLKKIKINKNNKFNDSAFIGIVSYKKKRLEFVPLLSRNIKKYVDHFPILWTDHSC